MRRLIANPRALLLLRASIASAAIAWGLGQLQALHEAAEQRLTDLTTDGDAAEARLARLLEAEEEAHEAAGDRADDAVHCHVPPAGGWVSPTTEPGAVFEISTADGGVVRPHLQVVPPQRDHDEP